VVSWTKVAVCFAISSPGKQRDPLGGHSRLFVVPLSISSFWSIADLDVTPEGRS
jgi:hypothetical protein